MNYQQAIQFLYELGMFGARLGLDIPRRLAALAGNPQESLRFIHVAGTNGKGSTCAMLESIYRHAGLRVGLFTSPHLVAFAERIQVNRQLIPEGEIARLMTEFHAWIQSFPTGQRPTFFEAVTVLALRYFAQQQCDLVVWETGLGGRLDATNIVTPLVSVITNIDFDHQQWLGDTLDKIAAEKAGIIKVGVPVITAAQPGRGLEVIAETARQLKSALTVVTPEDTRHLLPSSLALPLAGAHQRLNAALAVAAARALGERLALDEAAIARGLMSVHWAGRMQIVKFPDGRMLVLDGAHNPDGAAALRAAFDQQFPNARPTLLLGVLADKDWPAILRSLAPLAGRVVLTRVGSERTLDPTAMQKECAALFPDRPVIACSTLIDALNNTAQDRLVLVAGSLFLVGEAMERLCLSPTPVADERGLNDWNEALR